jgi:SAM-dependent methyltransferase
MNEPGAEEGTDQWKTHQRELWTERWDRNRYSTEDKISGPRGLIHDKEKLPVVLDHLEKHAIPGKEDHRLIEAGCGQGQWVIHLARKGYSITGLDFSEPVIAKLKEEYPDNEWVVGDVTNFEFGNGAFDAMLSWGVVEHFEKGPEKALDEAFRVIRNDGLLFITVPMRNHLDAFLSPFQGLKNALVSAGWFRKMLKLGPVNESEFYQLVNRDPRKKDRMKRSPTCPEYFYQYEFRRRDFEERIRKAGFTIFESRPILKTTGFIGPFAHLTGKQLFVKTPAGETDAVLTAFGNALKGFMNRLSPWFTARQIFIIARKP